MEWIGVVSGVFDTESTPDEDAVNIVEREAASRTRLRTERGCRARPQEQRRPARPVPQWRLLPASPWETTALARAGPPPGRETRTLTAARRDATRRDAPLSPRVALGLLGPLGPSRLPSRLPSSVGPRPARALGREPAGWAPQPGGRFKPWLRPMSLSVHNRTKAGAHSRFPFSKYSLQNEEHRTCQNVDLRTGGASGKLPAPLLPSGLSLRVPVLAHPRARKPGARISTGLGLLRISLSKSRMSVYFINE
ncbi:uncharacterized protein LOC110350480 [Heterocephalus glaber]|uniref:Uncharacterized protein LOC110350480 n=1 Tax=Heterocephalus glaber TaxID=10181 RepID=A0AAX6TG87_HETGA|nr:uncharacterized protein LOC110350480 [Heterocephalus glaber]